MSDPTTIAEWLRAGGIGVGAWAVLAVVVKAAADATGPAAARPTPPPAKTSVIEAPPQPAYPPSTGRHAGPAPADEARLLTTRTPAPVSLRKGSLSWI